MLPPRKSVLRTPVLRGSLFIASFAAKGEAKAEEAKAGAARAEARAEEKAGAAKGGAKAGARQRPNGAARKAPWAAEGWGRRRPDARL